MYDIKWIVFHGPLKFIILSWDKSTVWQDFANPRYELLHIIEWIPMRQHFGEGPIIYDYILLL